MRELTDTEKFTYGFCNKSHVYETSSRIFSEGIKIFYDFSC